MTGPLTTQPLSAQALEGLRVGISISESPDLDRLGLSWFHLEHAMREVVRTILVSGGTIAFGGDLRETPDSLTTPMLDEVERYATVQTATHGSRDDKALWLCLAWHLHRKVSKAALQQTRASLGQHGAIFYLNQVGEVLENRAQWADRPPEGVADEVPDDVQASSLTGLRSFLVKETKARVLLGGKREPRTKTFKNGYTGKMPGLIEEAILQLNRGFPIYLAGGFGGITLDLVAKIEPQVARVLLDPRIKYHKTTFDALEEFSQRMGSRGWGALNNGLSDDENRRLAQTHRPSEIAAWVALGLGRWRLEQRSLNQSTGRS